MTHRSLLERAARAPVALLLLLAACAPGVHRPGEAGRIEVVVENDLAPPAAVLVRVLLDTGDRVLLGDVPPSHSRVLRFSNPAGRSGMRLLAEVSGGRDITSGPFSAYSGDRVTWALTTNLVRVGEQEIPSEDRP